MESQLDAADTSTMVGVDAGRGRIFVSTEPVAIGPPNRGSHPMHRVQRGGVEFLVELSVARVLLAGKNSASAKDWARALNAVSKAASRKAADGRVRESASPPAPSARLSLLGPAHASPPRSTSSNSSRATTVSPLETEEAGGTTAIPAPAQADHSDIHEQVRLLAERVAALTSELDAVRLARSTEEAAQEADWSVEDSEPEAGATPRTLSPETEQTEQIEPECADKGATRRSARLALRPVRGNGPWAGEADEGATRVATPRRASLQGRTGLRPVANRFVQ
jgi:hypothetical protein